MGKKKAKATAVDSRAGQPETTPVEPQTKPSEALTQVVAPVPAPSVPLNPAAKEFIPQNCQVGASDDTNKSREEIMAERKAKKDAKMAGKKACKSKDKQPQTTRESGLVDKADKILDESNLKKHEVVANPKNKDHSTRIAKLEADTPDIKPSTSEVMMSANFSVLKDEILNHQYAGIDELCVKCVDNFKQLFSDHIFSANKIFNRDAEELVDANAGFLTSDLNVPFAVRDLVRHLKHQLRQSDTEDTDHDSAKNQMIEWLSSFVEYQINLASESICQMMRRKLSTMPTILVFSWSSLINKILLDAQSHGVDFEVFVVDTSLGAGQETLTSLIEAQIPVTYVHLTALHYIIKDVSLVLLSAESVLANGSILGRPGSNLIGLSAQLNNVPVLVACQTYKFTDRVVTGILYPTEAGKKSHCTSEIVTSDKISGIVTELRILPCSAVPAVVRSKMVS